MSALMPTGGALPASTEDGLALVREIEERVLSGDQVELRTQHVLHAGLYARTICVPAACVLTGALIKIPTLLIVSGRASVLMGDGEEVVIEGYNVLAASAGRKQAFIAHDDTYVTMVFATTARTVEEAEREFTDEWELLLSHHNDNDVLITGE